MKTVALAFLLILFPILNPAYAAVNNREVSDISQAVKLKPYKQENAKYAGYTMDSWTSASKLAAKRSHTIAGKDERNFAVFTGITVILMVVFFTQIIMSGK